MVRQKEEVAMHHWVATMQLVFVKQDDPTDGGALTLNAMLLTKDKVINAHSLAQLQRTGTANLMERLQDPTMKVVDIIFLSISHLGQMTQEEFNPSSAPVKPFTVV